MRKHASTMILILILVVGLSLMLYPSFSNWWNEAHQSRAIAAYSQEVSKLDENRYDELWQQAREYNRSLVGRENAYLLDDSQKAEYERLLDVSGMGIMGYIEIPSLNGAPTEAGLITFTPSVDTGTLSTDVINKSGSTLPETGGMGTTLFYVLGGVLVLAAVVLLVTKKRMRSEN